MIIFNETKRYPFTVQRFTPALARLDVRSWHDHTECYARSFYAMGQESKVWARGSRLESDED